MLVIRRRPGEVLMLGEDIEIEVLESSNSAVKLGIRAPKSVGVVRKEILVVGRQNVAASQPPDTAAVDRLLSQITRRPLSRNARSLR